jgi:hypothetical protein
MYSFIIQLSRWQADDRGNDGTFALQEIVHIFNNEKIWQKLLPVKITTLGWPIPQPNKGRVEARPGAVGCYGEDRGPGKRRPDCAWMILLPPVVSQRPLCYKALAVFCQFAEREGESNPRRKTLTARGPFLRLILEKNV